MAVLPPISVLDANNVPKSINATLPPGRAAVAESTPTVLSAEDKAALDAVSTGLGTVNSSVGAVSSGVGATTDTSATTDGGTFSLISLVKRALAGIATLVSQTQKGVVAKTSSQSVNPATDADPFPILVFQPSGSASLLSVSSVSASMALPAGAILRLSNSSSVPVCVAFGASGVVATTGDMDILPGNAECFRPPAGATHIAAIVAQGATTLKVVPGNGA